MILFLMVVVGKLPYCAPSVICQLPTARESTRYCVDAKIGQRDGDASFVGTIFQEANESLFWNVLLKASSRSNFLGGHKLAAVKS